MENTTQLFLAVRFNCNKCHDHPFERWTQDQYYQTAAFFAQVGLKADPASGGQTIGGTAVEAAKPLYEIVADTGRGRGRTTTGPSRSPPPKFPFPCDVPKPAERPRRRERAGRVDHLEGQPVLRPELRQPALGLPVRRRHHRADRRHPRRQPADQPRAARLPDRRSSSRAASTSGTSMRLICKSRTYQLSVATNKWNEDDKINYSHAIARRLPAEVLLDAVYRVTGSVVEVPGRRRRAPAPPACPTRASSCPAASSTTFGRPARESACECERSSGLQLGPVMALVSGPTLGDAIADPANELTKLVAPRERRRQADRRAVPPHPQPAGDARRRSPTCREDIAVRSTTTTASWPRTWAGARSSSPSSGPQLERERAGRHRRGPGRAGRLREGAGPEARRSRRRRRPTQTAKLEADLKAYEATAPGQEAGRVGEGPGRPVVNRWAAARAEGAERHQRRDADQGSPTARSSSAGKNEQRRSSRSSPRPT